MAADSTAITKRSIDAMLVVPEEGVLAVAGRETALAIYAGIKPDKHDYDPRSNLLVSETYVGIYGAVGRVELTNGNAEVHLVGVVYIPKECVQLVQLICTDKDYEAFLFQFFGKTCDWRQTKTDLNAQSASVDAAVKGEIPFLSGKGYYFVIRRPESYDFENRLPHQKGAFADGRPLPEQVRELEELVTATIRALDEKLQSLDPRAAGTEITPEYAAQRYTSMTGGRAIVAGMNDVKLLPGGHLR